MRKKWRLSKPIAGNKIWRWGPVSCQHR